MKKNLSLVRRMSQRSVSITKGAKEVPRNGIGSSLLNLLIETNEGKLHWVRPQPSRVKSVRDVWASWMPQATNWTQKVVHPVNGKCSVMPMAELSLLGFKKLWIMDIPLEVKIRRILAVWTFWCGGFTAPIPLRLWLSFPLATPL